MQESLQTRGSPSSEPSVHTRGSPHRPARTIDKKASKGRTHPRKEIKRLGLSTNHPPPHSSTKIYRSYYSLSMYGYFISLYHLLTFLTPNRFLSSLPPSNTSATTRNSTWIERVSGHSHKECLMLVWFSTSGTPRTNRRDDPVGPFSTKRSQMVLPPYPQRFSSLPGLRVYRNRSTPSSGRLWKS
jgi:hypothetical protein